ncbi:hypothetical protein EON66_08295 [archaeon]|nr:MAG: hypothetical protein EON66_08295 [archaeon]
MYVLRKSAAVVGCCGGQQAIDPASHPSFQRRVADGISPAPHHPRYLHVRSMLHPDVVLCWTRRLGRVSVCASVQQRSDAHQVPEGRPWTRRRGKRHRGAALAASRG